MRVVHAIVRLSWVALLAAGCVAQEDPGPLDDVAGGQRFQPTFLAFDDWTDIITVHVAVDSTCDFLTPQLEDYSTFWAPLQVFWVVYDDPSDARDGTVIEDTYFPGDSIRIDEYPRLAGKDPIGFQFITPIQRALLPLKDAYADPSGRRIEAAFGGGVDLRIAMDSVSAEDGTCEIVTTYCYDPCSRAPEDWRSLESVFFTLGFLYSIQDVEIIED